MPPVSRGLETRLDFTGGLSHGANLLFYVI